MKPYLFTSGRQHPVIDADIPDDEWMVLKVLAPGTAKAQIIKLQDEYGQTSNGLLR